MDLSGGEGAGELVFGLVDDFGRLFGMVLVDLLVELFEEVAFVEVFVLEAVPSLDFGLFVEEGGDFVAVQLIVH